MTKFRAASGIVGLSLIAACGDPNASGLGGSQDRAGNATGGAATGGAAGASDSGGTGGYIEPGVGGEAGTGSTGGAPAASCSDSTQNGGESDTDCGGGCAPCGVGLACNGADDCTSSSCVAGTCAAASCSDLVRNGDETDVDCGGSCDPCGDESACSSDSDCASGVCRAKTPVDNGPDNDDEGDGEHHDRPCDGVCLPASCDDGIKNAGETDVDCGDSCEPCAAGKACATGQDCRSGVCNDGTCAEPSCGDAVTNGTDDCDTGGDSLICNADCTFAACGDGYVNRSALEACDEGGADTATCDSDCSEPRCGDGHFNAAAGEACDDGEDSPDCDYDCTLPTCGDGYKNARAGESCDDGGVDTATCDHDCSDARCGDGYLNTAAGEECDDGDLDDTDACDNHCKFHAPSACEGGTDHSSGDSWVVCAADQTEAWVSADSSGEYHPELICKSLGYSAVGAWDATYGSVCGYRESSTCTSPGTKQLSRPWTGTGNCGSDELGQKLCYTVQWSCTR